MATLQLGIPQAQTRRWHSGTGMGSPSSSDSAHLDCASLASKLPSVQEAANKNPQQQQLAVHASRCTTFTAYVPRLPASSTLCWKQMLPQAAADLLSEFSSMRLQRPRAQGSFLVSEDLVAHCRHLGRRGKVDTHFTAPGARSVWNVDLRHAPNSLSSSSIGGRDTHVLH